MAFALRILNGNRGGESFSLSEGRVLTIGRDAENDIRLADRKLSRIHCQLEVIGGRCQVADLNSTNGTRVNGEVLEGAMWVTPDDDIELGVTSMKVVELSEVEAEAEAEAGAEAEDPNVETATDEPEGEVDGIRCEECGRVIPAEAMGSGAVRRVGSRCYCGDCVATFEVADDAPAAPAAVDAPPSVADQFGPGKELAGVRIISQVGEGRLGPVYKGEQTSMGRLVALRVLNVTDPEWAKRYLQAVYASGQLVHANIALIFDTGEVDGAYYVIREYVEGKSAEDLVAARRPVRLQEAYTIVTQVAYALERACEQRIFHGGLCPRKILLGPRDAVKVTGFGLPQTAPPGHNETMYIWHALPYMAPERLGSEGALDFAGDVYSLVAIFYHLLTGRSPISGSTREKLERRILRRAPKPLKAYVPDAPDVAQKIVERGLSKDPRARYQLPRELLYDLEENLRREM